MDCDREKSLIEAAQQGNQAAFGELFDHYLPRVYARVCSLVPITDTEDVTQEIFISIARSIQSFRGDSSLSTWIYKIIKWRVADYYRKTSRQVQQVTLSDDYDTPIENSTRTIEETIDLKRILAFLSEQQREVILLRLVDGLPFSEVASRMEIEIGAAKVRFYRAVAACQKKMAEIQV